MKKIGSLLRALELLRRKVHRELPVQQLVLFLTVVENPGITMPGLVELLGMPQGTVSRNVKALSHYVVWQDGVAVPRGRNLLRTLADDTNRQVLAVYTTGRGEALAQELSRVLAADDSDDGTAEPAVARFSQDAGLDALRYWPRTEVRQF